MLALVGYFVFVPQQVPQYSRLDTLVVQAPGIAGLDSRPTSSSAESPATGSSVQELGTAAQQSPLSTGLWSIDWTPAGKGAGLLSEAQLELYQLPSTHDAMLVRSEVDAASLVAATYPKYRAEGTFSLPASLSKGSPSSGATFVRPKSKSLARSSISVMTVQSGRAVAFVYFQAPGSTRAGATALAERELALLRRQEPGFVLAGTQYPLVASILWWLVALALAVLVVVGPKLALAAQAKRRAHTEALERAQFQMRGAKVLKRRSGARSSGPGRRGARR